MKMLQKIIDLESLEIFQKNLNGVSFSKVTSLRFSDCNFTIKRTHHRFFLEYVPKTDEFIGFIDFWHPELSFSTFTGSNQLVTHALVYYVRGLCVILKFSVAYFATHHVALFLPANANILESSINSRINWQTTCNSSCFILLLTKLKILSNASFTL